MSIFEELLSGGGMDGILENILGGIGNPNRPPSGPYIENPDYADWLIGDQDASAPPRFLEVMGLEGMLGGEEDEGGTPGSTDPLEGVTDTNGDGVVTLADLVYQDLIADPSYQFRLQEGIDAREARAAAMGQRYSGNILEELTRYGQDFASQEYANAYSRLADITGMGGQGTTAATIGANTSNALGNILGQLGSSQANSALMQGNINSNMWNSTLGGIGNLLTTNSLLNN